MFYKCIKNLIFHIFKYIFKTRVLLYLYYACICENFVNVMFSNWKLYLWCRNYLQFLNHCLLDVSIINFSIFKYYFKKCVFIDCYYACILYFFQVCLNLIIQMVTTKLIWRLFSLIFSLFFMNIFISLSVTYPLMLMDYLQVRVWIYF